MAPKYDYTELDRSIIVHCLSNSHIHPVWADPVRERAKELFDGQGLTKWRLETRIINMISRRLTALRKDGVLAYDSFHKRWEIDKL